MDIDSLSYVLNSNRFSGAIFAFLGAVIGAVLTVTVGHFLAKRRQRGMRIKEFDKLNVERVWSVFEEILVTIDKKCEIVDEELISKLSARVVLMGSEGSRVQEKINELKRACFSHRDGVKKSASSTTGISQEEQQAAEDIKGVISELRNEMRSLYSR